MAQCSSEGETRSKRQDEPALHRKDPHLHKAEVTLVGDNDEINVVFLYRKLFSSYDPLLNPTHCAVIQNVRQQLLF